MILTLVLCVVGALCYIGVSEQHSYIDYGLDKIYRKETATFIAVFRDLNDDTVSVNDCSSLQTDFLPTVDGLTLEWYESSTGVCSVDITPQKDWDRVSYTLSVTYQGGTIDKEVEYVKLGFWGSIFSIHSICFVALDYVVSWVELIGTVFGLACVLMTALEMWLSWPVGIVNVIFFMVLFYQYQLYSDLILNVYFLVTGFYGWYRWVRPRAADRNEDAASKNKVLRITTLRNCTRLVFTAVIVVATAGVGTFVKYLHVIIPAWFPEPASYPYFDTFTSTLSIVSQAIMTEKKIECWVLWVIADIIDTGIYFKKGILLVGVEYALFLVIAASGGVGWFREIGTYDEFRGLGKRARLVRLVRAPWRTRARADVSEIESAVVSEESATSRAPSSSARPSTRSLASSRTPSSAPASAR